MGGSTGSPRCRRIFSIAARSAIVASSRKRPPQSGRDDVELEAKLRAAETIVADLESLRLALAGPEAPTPEQVTQRLKDRLAN